MDVLLNVYVCTLMKKSALLLPEGTSGTIANLHRTPTEINKNGAIAKIRILLK